MSEFDIFDEMLDELEIKRKNRLEKVKQYKKANKEKLRASNNKASLKYRNANRDRINAYYREYYKNNIEKCREKQRKSYYKNRDRNE
jgi:hypothetical protein